MHASLSQGVWGSMTYPVSSVVAEGLDRLIPTKTSKFVVQLFGRGFGWLRMG